MKELLSLARPEILKLKPYASARSLITHGRIFLDANESPDETSNEIPPSFSKPLNRYPEPQPRALSDRFSELYSVSPSQLLICRGSDEAIDLLVRAFCESAKDGILICPPTYGMYEVSAEIQGARVIRVPLLFQPSPSGRGFDVKLDEAAIVETVMKASANIKLVFICNPNNPTGTSFDQNSLKRICKATFGRCLVILDEAYVEFDPDGSMINELKEYPNLVILRTLSKAWALAGARCGVAIANESVIQLLQKLRPPYPLSTPTIRAVLEAIRPENIIQKRISIIRDERDKLLTALKELPFFDFAFASSANFLLVKFTGAENINKTLVEALSSKGIIVRDRSHEVGLAGCVRITVGSENENRQVILALQEVAKQAISNDILSLTETQEALQK